MIMTVEKLRSYISTDESDTILKERLEAIELLVRRYTNNNFQNRNIRYTVNIVGGCIVCPSAYLKTGDTIQISDSTYNAGLVTIQSASDDMLLFEEDLYDENNVLITKVEYPPDVQMGVVKMIQWDLTNGKKVGIQSETISRHSVTYFNMDGENQTAGYPKSLCGFMKQYIKARF